MASLYKEIRIEAAAAVIWDAARDVGALHTRLVPGFVVDTQLDAGGRVVTFGNGMKLREPIIIGTPKLPVSVSPQAGFLHQTSVLDTLGYDKPETKCKAYTQ